MKKDEIKQQLDKVVVNVGLGRLSQQANFSDKILPDAVLEFSAITGQKPLFAPAKKSIAGFKIREGNIVGLKCTLRGNRMMQFLNKFVNVALPRVRDFRGISKDSVDEGGSLTIGLKEHIVFPEISAETSKVAFGLEITVVPKEKRRDKAMELYAKIGIPFKKQ